MKCVACEIKLMHKNLGINHRDSKLVETLDNGGKTVSIWEVPVYMSLDHVCQRQGKSKFREAYRVCGFPVGTLRTHTCNN